MRRKNRLLLAVYSFGFLGGALPAAAFAFNTPGDAGEPVGDPAEPVGDPAGGGAAAATVVVTPGKPVKDLAAIKSRDKAKAALRQVATSLGIDPDEIEITGAGTDAEPYVIADLDELLETAGVKKSGKKTVIDEAARSRIIGPEKRKREAAEREVKALRDFIAREYVVNEIRIAARKNCATDVDNGQFNAVVRLVKPIFRPTVTVDPETNKAEVELAAFDPETSEPIYADDAETPLTVDAAVKKELQSNAMLRNSSLRGGPGAGGHSVNGNGAASTRRQGVLAGAASTPEAETAEQVNAFFGAAPPG